MRVHRNTVAAVGLAALILAAPSLAAPGHGGPGGGRGPGGGGSYLYSRVTGTITAIGTNTVTVTSANGTATVLTVASGTKIIGKQTITADAVAVGDTLMVSGVPVTLQAATIVDNKLTNASSTTTSTAGTGTTPAPPSGGTAPVPGTLFVTGVVTTVSPLTIEVDSDFSLALTTTSATTLSEVSALTLSQLTTGEAVIALTVTSGTTTTARELDVTF